MPKVVALLGGGDWADASVVHVVIPDGMDLKEQSTAWLKWYVEEYHSGRDDYCNFEMWLINRGARKATKDDVIEFEEP